MDATPTRLPAARLRVVNRAPLRADRDFVLYWMIAARRLSHSFALDRAVEWALALDKPLVILEALRCGYPWASDRLHRFVIEGMAEKARALSRSPVLYYPYLEPEPGAGKGLLRALAARAVAVVTDEFPAFFLPRMVVAAGALLDVRLEAIDGNGLLPLGATERVFPTAFVFRRFLQREIGGQLGVFPRPRPLASRRLRPVRALPPVLVRRYPPAAPAALADAGSLVARLPIDHAVGAAAMRGGEAQARAALRRFLADGLPGYARDRSHPDEGHESGLSPYLHFGQVSVHEVFKRVAAGEGWTPDRLSRRADGRRAGFWGMGEDAEAFLDQLVTWRELGFQFCARRPDHDRFAALPPWAQRTLRRHSRDRRPFVYSPDELAAGGTHDRLWNAAQTELRREGRLQNYLRMLWGKKVLEWSPGPEQALAALFDLNNRYAVDGRDPNSTSGILWTLGRFDRPWEPERPVFGTVRYLSSQNAARKLRLKGYIARHGSGQ